MSENYFKMPPLDISDSVCVDNKSIYSEFDEISQTTALNTITELRCLFIYDNNNVQLLSVPYVESEKIFFDELDDEDLKSSFFLHVLNGRLYANCVRPAFFLNCEDSICDSLEITKNCLLNMESLGHKYLIYVEQINDQNKLFHNYQTVNLKEITVGKNMNNDIVYENNYILDLHAVFTWQAGNWSVKAHNNAIGIVVNNKVVDYAKLQVGDIIYIWGLQIIIGIGFFSINDGNEQYIISTDNFRKVKTAQNIYSLERPLLEEEDKLFNRLPRQRLAMELNDIVIEAPPLSLNSSQIPLLLRMGGSMVMGGASALAGNYIMLLSSVLFPILTQKYSEKEKKEYEERRIKSYHEYLNDKKVEIKKEVENEEYVLEQNYPELNNVLDYSFSEKKLWERRKTDDDFLRIRIGKGDIPLIAKIDYPQHRFTIDEDELENKMYELAEKEILLHSMPIMVDFIDHFLCGITGNKKDKIRLICQIVMMTVLLHSYDEVKTIFIVDSEELSDIEFVKYIPHSWNNQKDFRYIATNPSEALQIGEFLKQELEMDIDKPRKLKEILKSRPYYMVFALNKQIFDTIEILKSVMQSEENCGITIITAFDDIPKDCSLLFTLDKEEKTVINLKQIEQKNSLFDFDEFDSILAHESMCKMSNTKLKIITQAYSLPKTITFLEMFGVGRIEHLNPLKRWKESNPAQTLKTPIGVSTDGSTFMLDLHQKYQGPHGLVAGTTGSGKSEFLLTYILSMAVNYHPDEVQFLLIDYKGGGLAGAFDDEDHGIHLPHVVGTITNLDGASIQRSLISIQSELIRRQKIFNNVKKITDEATMDIYSYQRLYRNNLVEEPMSHLFIISDEFAELKQQQPEFMDSLISAARIGRSLGVHLILATQKPSGVVNDQIRSNTKFRVCLKVQDKADSNDMLKRPEAAELKDTGRFYLQVGYNEFFALGQSAWSGAEYFPQDEVVVQKDDSIQFVDSIGQNILEIRPQKDKIVSCGSQLNAVVKMLSNVAKENNIKSKMLWKPELPSKIDVSLFNKEHSCVEDYLNTYIGILDDPENQQQIPLYIDLMHCQNIMLIGDSGSGKSTLFQTIIYSIAKEYSPEQVNFYILDFSSRMLKVFNNLPHCGGVLCEDEVDALDNFFKLINKYILERKKIFSELEVDTYEAAIEIKPLPLILVFIDNVSGLSETKIGEIHSYNLPRYLRDSVKYGVKYIISCKHLNDTSSKIKQELKDRIAFHLKDKFEYSEALDCKVTYTPTELSGRCLYNYKDRPLELQLAYYFPEKSDKERLQIIKEGINEISDIYSGFLPAKRLPTISETVSYEEFARQFSNGRIPLGYSKKNQKAVALPLRQFSMLSIYIGNPIGNLAIIDNFVYAALKEKMDVWVIKRMENSIFHSDSSEHINKILKNNQHIYELSLSQMQIVWKQLSEEMGKRRKILEDYCIEQGIDEEQNEYEDLAFDFLYENTSPLLLFIESFYDFSSILDDISSLVFDKLFQTAQKRNIYILACFETEEKKEIKNKTLYYGFNPDELIMLFGGNFDKQSICQINLPNINNAGTLQFNVALMQYKKDIYPMLMPCGEIKTEDINEDKESIF